MIFKNAQIPVADLPSVAQVEWNRLSASYRQVEVVATTLFFLLLLVGWGVFYIVDPFKMPWLIWAAFAGWAGLYALSLRAAFRRFAAEGYALRSHDILHKHGVWWRTVTAIPFNRMQHCEISRGPIENLFGLATLRVYTAGGSSSDLSIEGLPFEEAQRVKEHITQRIGQTHTQSNPPSMSNDSEANDRRSPMTNDGEA